MLNIEECQIDRLVNFMGHHKDIHKNIYRMPISVAEMTDISRLLMAAIGDGNKENDEECSDENSDSSDEENDHVIPMIERTETIKDYTDDTYTFDNENISASLSTNNSTNSKCRNSKVYYFYIKHYFFHYFYYGNIVNVILL